MKSKFINLVKGNRIIYLIYDSLFSSILRLLGLIIKSDKDQVLFVCYGGRKYGDNVRPVFLEMLNDERFNSWHFVWAFRNPETVCLPDNERVSKCKIDSLSFFLHALCSKIWITNVDVERGLHFKNKGTFYVNLWHGVPMKLIRLDNVKATGLKVKAKKAEIDLVCAMGNYDAKIALSAFGVTEDRVKVTGYPRNDVMFTTTKEEAKRRISKFYDIDYSKKIVFYAPTFRDYNTSNCGEFQFDLRLSKDKFSNILGEDFCLLIRAHGAIEGKSVSKGFIDVSLYPDIEDLMLVSDILVSDYSSVVFEFTLLDKPVVCFSYDLDKYIESRGLYINYNTFLPFKKCKTEDELYKTIKELDFEKESEISRQFKLKCGFVGYGATKNVVNEIYSILNNDK